ncbi:hypothetical protein CSAL01_05962 [Colletotrichum salicis]|uniref:N-acetyltransferase domain-containing protein n=1 Tax=Colletotrichum salicis TaxID=1209931 RepID=A0A135V7N5_9PEZI|nr:hypothetical protein CSAL01_05962 [Colletotrichum salicis]
MHSREMHIEVQRCTEKDIPRVFEIVSLAFANDHEFVDAIFPAHSSPEGRKLGSERMLATFHGDPYIASSSSGPVPPPPQLDGGYWKNKEEKRFAQALFHGFFAPRQQAIEESGARLVALDMLMCDPDYQGQGAGRLLLKAGLSIADEMGVDAVVEGSDRDRRLYASEGFDGPHYVCSVPDEFAARRKQTYWWMRRSNTSVQKKLT